MKKVIIGNRELSREEVEQLYYSISLRLGYIETGTNARAIDMQRANKDFKPKVLTKDQMKLIVLLEDIMEEMLSIL